MKKQKTTHSSMAGRVCIITGADSGIGFETSKQLAQHSAHLVMVCRNPQRADNAVQQIRAVAHGPVDVIQGELSSLQAVRKLASDLLQRYQQIHLLINNAGVMFNRRELTVDGFERVFAVNYLAPFLLTHLLLDRLKASAPARIINISSKGHQFGGLDLTDLRWEKRRFSGLKAYGASKMAINHFTRQLAAQLAGSDVTVNAAHPGEVLTNIGMDNGPVYLWIKKHLINKLLKPASIAGEAIYYLAASPQLAHTSGQYFNMTHAEALREDTYSHEVARELWRLSEQLTGISTSPH
jgi:NAD(P)-dependent dehydrogenase (short-subunit alcohol dehydrogenase family)